MKTEAASQSITPLTALTRILVSAVHTAESWVNCLELETFPCNIDDWDVLSAHPSISQGWRWENWDEFIVDRNQCDFIKCACKGCPDVEALRARLEHAMKLIHTFAEVADIHVDDFCR